METSSRTLSVFCVRVSIAKQVEEKVVEGILFCYLNSLNLRSRSKFKMQNNLVHLFSAAQLLLFTLKYARSRKMSN